MVTLKMLIDLFCLAQQGMVIFSGVSVYLLRFCLSNIFAKHATDGLALSMYGQHNLYCNLLGQIKKSFQYLYNKVHRGKIIVQEQDLIHWRWFELGFLRLDR